MTIKQLSPEQNVAIQWLSLPKRGGKTYDEIAELSGVHVNTIYKWRKDTDFLAELKREIVRQTIDRLPQVMDSLADAAITDHNAAAAKLLLQANDMLTDNIVVDTKQSDKTDIDALRERLRAFNERNPHSDKITPYNEAT